MINLRPGDDACDALVADLEAKLKKADLDVLVDDRDERPGAKFATMDLIGLALAGGDRAARDQIRRRRTQEAR